MGGEIVGGAFAASVKHGQSVKQVLWRASFVDVTFTSRADGRLSEKY